METVRRQLGADWLFMLALIVSVAGHLVFSWLGLGAAALPQLADPEAGRTSVRIQLVSDAPPPSAPNARPPAPLPLESLLPVPAATPPPSLAPLLMRVQRPHTTVATLVRPADLGAELLPPQQETPPKSAPPDRIYLAPTSHVTPHQPRTAHRAIARKLTLPTFEPGNAKVDLPQTRVSRQSTGNEVPPAFVTRPLPAYPRELLEAGIGGIVQLLVTVDRYGRVAKAKVYSSSGHIALDMSALRTVRRWVFTPARRGNIAIQKQVIVPVQFQVSG